MATKTQYEIFQTPVGELIYPWISAPDTRYNKGGVFQTKIRLPFAEAQALIAQAERVLDAEFSKLDTQKSMRYSKKPVYEPVYTEPPVNATDEQKASFVPEPTDFVEFRCKLNRTVTPQNGEAFEQDLPVIDMDGVRLDVPVWGGTKAVIRGQLVPWVNAAQNQVGVTLRMKAVQVHDLVTGEGSSWTKFD